MFILNNMYPNNFIELKDKNIIHSNFKQNSILEGLTQEQGNMYLSQIHKEFSNISLLSIFEFVEMIDVFGNPLRFPFTYNQIKFVCSPTPLRFIYHSLLILKRVEAILEEAEIENNTIPKISFVELRGGYGGLFLAISFFSTFFKIPDGVFSTYHFVDVNDALEYVIDPYLKNYKYLFEKVFRDGYKLHDAINYGMDIQSPDITPTTPILQSSSSSSQIHQLFFISNYCFTEIDEISRIKFISLIYKAQHGFITWQTFYGVGIDKNRISKYLLEKDINKIVIEEERPQTSPHSEKNYFVMF